MEIFILAGGGSLLSFNTGFAIWVLISTLVFAFLMQKFLIPPVMKALNDREARIKESLESAEKALEKAEKISQENKSALRDAEIKAQKIRKEALNDAEVIRAEKIEKAKVEADKVLVNAKKTIEQEKKRALEELRNEVADLAVKAASMIIDAELDEKKNKKLVNQFIKELPKN